MMNTLSFNHNVSLAEICDELVLPTQYEEGNAPNVIEALKNKLVLEDGNTINNISKIPKLWWNLHFVMIPSNELSKIINSWDLKNFTRGTIITIDNCTLFSTKSKFIAAIISDLTDECLLTLCKVDIR